MTEHVNEGRARLYGEECAETSNAWNLCKLNTRQTMKKVDQIYAKTKLNPKRGKEQKEWKSLRTGK